MRVEQLDLFCETKTSDNVICSIAIAVQYKITDPYKNYYSLTNPKLQIQAYVEDSIRATIPRMTLDKAYACTSEIAISTKEQLTAVFDGYGLTILQTLITDLAPNRFVREAMNEINASRRLKEASEDRAEAEKILVVKNAEAHSEGMYLSGVGVARQRKAIMDGLKESVGQFSQRVGDTNNTEIINMMMTVQYLDMLKEVGANQPTALYLEHSPSSVSEVQRQINEGMKNISAQARSAAGLPVPQGMDRGMTSLFGGTKSS
jgi:regulator of protease activity HflC (stomatin/prohibitin superfamily)